MGVRVLTPSDAAIGEKRHFFFCAPPFVLEYNDSENRPRGVFCLAYYSLAVPVLLVER